MDPSEILRARAMTALREGNDAEAERLFSADLATSRDCLSRAGLAISQVRQGKDPVALEDCREHPAAMAFTIETADIDDVIDILGTVEAEGMALEMITGSGEVRAAELLGSGRYADHLKVHDILSAITDDRDRLQWGITATIDSVERNGHHERLSADLDGLDTGLRKEITGAIERQYTSILEGERFERAAEYCNAFDFLERQPLISSLERAAENAEEYGHVREALRYYHLASELSGEEEVRSNAADRVRDLARREITRGELGTALDLLKEAVGFSKIDVRNEYSEIAHGFVREGSYDRAVDLYLDIEERYPGSKTAYHLKDIANRLKSERRWDEAVTLYRQIADIDPEFDIDRYLVLIGKALLDRREYQAAIDMMADARTEEPRLFVHRADALIGLGDTKGALRILMRTGRKWPDDITVLGALSDLYADLKRPERAAEYASRALEIDPTAKWAQARVGEDLRRRISSSEEERDFTGAYRLYTEYLDIFPRDRWALGRRKICLELMRRHDRRSWKDITGGRKRRWGLR